MFVKLPLGSDENQGRSPRRALLGDVIPYWEGIRSIGWPHNAHLGLSGVLGKGKANLVWKDSLDRGRAGCEKPSVPSVPSCDSYNVCG